MLKNNVGPLVIVLGVASCIWSCSNSSDNKTGATSTGGETAAGGSATGGRTGGGATATGGKSTTGGSQSAAGASATGGALATGGAPATGGATGTSTMTLAQACATICPLASGVTGCSTTTDVCVQNCNTTFVNTSAVNTGLGREYTTMMVCVATNFTSAADYICAKPNSPLNVWSPAGTDVVPNSPCELDICQWNCDDGTVGNRDPWVDVRCSCSSV